MRSREQRSEIRDQRSENSDKGPASNIQGPDQGLGTKELGTWETMLDAAE